VIQGAPAEGYRSGFVAVVGRPNVGKSTLVNAVLGTKVTITSPRPNTTRRTVRGVLHRPGLQAVFVDTPGLHKPRTALGERLNEQIDEALQEVDIVAAVVDATMPIGPGDARVLRRAAAAVRTATNPDSGGPQGRPGLVVVVNKIDRAHRRQVLERLDQARRLVEPDERDASDEVGPGRDQEADVPVDVDYWPVSATTGEGVADLVDAVLTRLPPGPPYFPDDMVTDVPEAFWVAELTREQLLARARDELPHAIACRVTEWEWPRIRIEIIVERDSQKGMVIGRGGQVLKEVGTAVREQLPPGAFVELHVRVDKAWQQRPDVIARLGY
jgi:GTPase